jgi:hypothetical protein
MVLERQWPAQIGARQQGHHAAARLAARIDGALDRGGIIGDAIMTRPRATGSQISTAAWAPMGDKAASITDDRARRRKAKIDMGSQSARQRMNVK